MRAHDAHSVSTPNRGWSATVGDGGDSYRAALKLFNLCKGIAHRKSKTRNLRTQSGSRKWVESPRVVTAIGSYGEVVTTSVSGGYAGAHGRKTVEVPMTITAALHDEPVYTLPVQTGAPMQRSRTTHRAVRHHTLTGKTMECRRDRRDATHYAHQFEGPRVQRVSKSRDAAVTVGQCVALDEGEQHLFIDWQGRRE